jgi:DNA/RNA-binding domain of Phe-tRNA-synthetase-like protein
MSNEILIEITPDVRDCFPEIRCGGFRASGLSVLHEKTVVLSDDEIRSALTSQGISVDTVTQDRRIGDWRAAIQRCGLKAAKVRGSAEQLVRRYLRGDSISGPPLVRLYCGASAYSVAPLGGYDVDRLPSLEIQLRFSQSGDAFQPLGGNIADMPLKPSIPVYAAGNEVLCWMFNVRDSVATSLSEATTQALFLTEALTPAQANASTEALATLRRLLCEAGAQAGPVAWTDQSGRLSVR